MRLSHVFALALAVPACGGTPQPPPPAPPLLVPASATPSASASSPPPVADAGASTGTPPAPELRFVSKPFPLPGATGAVLLDYLAVDRAAGRVWIPAGNTASVDVIEIATGQVTRIEGFPTVEREVRGKKRIVGPSSASIGDGFVYVGNRANSQVCAVDAVKLTRGACVTLASSPDGVQYVAATKEVWVTTPRDKSITVLDASTPARLKAKTKISFDGEPEGYAVDDAKGVFYTNLEDKDKTVVIDARTHKVTSTWSSQCGSEGPRGLAVDAAKGFLFVACTDHVEVLDLAHDGALLSKLDAGAGIDNIDYLAARGLLYIAAGKAATLTVAQVDEKGMLTLRGTAPTSEGTRVVVVDNAGTAYVADPMQGRVLAVSVSTTN